MKHLVYCENSDDALYWFNIQDERYQREQRLAWSLRSPCLLHRLVDGKAIYYSYSDNLSTVIHGKTFSSIAIPRSITRLPPILKLSLSPQCMYWYLGGLYDQDIIYCPSSLWK